jgi:hypothetical protein
MESRNKRPNKWLKRTPPSVTPPAGTEAQASCHPAAPPLSHTVRVPGLSPSGLEQDRRTPAGGVGVSVERIMDCSAGTVVGAHSVRRGGRTSAARRSGIVLSLLAIVSLGCSDRVCNCTGPAVPVSGRAVLQAWFRVDGDAASYNQGFSFSESQVVELSYPMTTEPDVIALVYRGRDGMPVADFLVQQGAIAVGAGVTLEAGRDLFEGTECVPDGATFARLSDMVKPFEVWLIRTHDGRFAKIFVIDAVFWRQGPNSDGLPVGGCYQVTFEWAFQPNGTRCFE